MIKLLIVEDHHLVRTGLRNILNDTSDVAIVGEASSGELAIQFNREQQPDVILMDIGLPGLSGFETSERILKTSPNAKIVVLTSRTQAPYPTQLLEIGAMGYLSKACDAEELLRAIRAVHRGERYIGAEIAQQLAVSLLPGEPKSPFQKLTPRELELALMFAQGMKASSIAETVSISPKTVASHKYNIYQKIGVNSEVALLLAAIRHGLIKPDE
ncbi:MAG: response regulator [Symploca sp. SIO2G7]|nr:response regulator [Symploca sp. SIO2G7]